MDNGSLHSTDKFKVSMSREKRNRLITLALLVITLMMMIPVATTLVTSFKKQADITRDPPIFFPCDTEQRRFDIRECRWAVEGYERVLGYQKDETALLGFKLTSRMVQIYLPNTILYALGTAIFVTILAAFAGYAFSRYKFWGHNALLVSLFAVTGVPLMTNMLAIYQMSIVLRRTWNSFIETIPYMNLPSYDDRFFLIFVYVGFFLPIGVWIAKGFFDAIPRELEESAMVEGCTPIGALIRVTMPLSAPGLSAVFLLTFVNIWNEFIVAYLLVPTTEYKPAMVGLYDFLSQNLINLQVLAAVCLIIALPILILFLLFRQSFLRAMVEGAIKG